jgi:hypothetical protein
MTGAPERPSCSPLRRQMADVLRRARKLPVGPDRNDLRQLAMGLRWLERNGFETRPWSAAGAAPSEAKNSSERTLP